MKPAVCPKKGRKHVLRVIRELYYFQPRGRGTDIGGALAGLNRGALREASTRSTVAIIISDGYDSGDTSVIDREMRALRRHVRTVVWINPMYGASTFEPRAQGMRAALPYIDHFLPAFNAQSLRVLVRELARV